VNTHARLIRLLIIALLGLAGLTAFTESHASWETLRVARADDRNCARAYDQQFILARRENRSLQIKPGVDVELEV
jgi:hypothetical protein